MEMFWELAEGNDNFDQGSHCCDSRSGVGKARNNRRLGCQERTYLQEGEIQSCRSCPGRWLGLDVGGYESVKVRERKMKVIMPEDG